MTHKEVLESLLSGQIVEREGLLCSYLYKMVDETIYYVIPYGISRHDWKPIEVINDYVCENGMDDYSDKILKALLGEDYQKEYLIGVRKSL